MRCGPRATRRVESRRGYRTLGRGRKGSRRARPDGRNMVLTWHRCRELARRREPNRARSGRTTDAATRARRLRGDLLRARRFRADVARRQGLRDPCGRLHRLQELPRGAHHPRRRRRPRRDRVRPARVPRLRASFHAAGRCGRSRASSRSRRDIPGTASRSSNGRSRKLRVRRRSSTCRTSSRRSAAAAADETSQERPAHAGPG